MTTFLDLMPKFTAPVLCATEGSPDDWHPPSGGEGARIAERAKAICRRCPAVGECRAYALTNPGVAGIWGGWSQRDREDMRRESPQPKRQRTRCAQGHAYTPENTREATGGRRCRTCHNRANRKREQEAAK